MVAAIGLASAFGSGCRDINSPRGTREEQSVTQQEVITTQSTTLDDQFADLARAIPGFGGIFIGSDGQPTAYLKDMTQAPLATAVLTPLLATHQAAGRTIRFKQGVYDYLELTAWNKPLTSALTIDGVVFTDIDEANNKLAVGVESADVGATVMNYLSGFGIPAAAVLIKLRDRAVLTQTLSDSVRPMLPGIRVGMYYGAGTGSSCTHGQNVRKSPNDGYEYFLMNSHCSGISGTVDTMMYRQPLSGSSSSLRIADEVTDPAWRDSTYYPACPATKLCRYSDAALLKYRSGATITSAFGKIARTKTFGLGSDTLNATYPSMTISTVGADPWYNNEMEKVGATTGWTGYNLSDTCLSFNHSSGANHVLLCQYAVAVAGVDYGDSGAPVFWSNGNLTNMQAELHGILWGKMGTAASYFIFSPQSGIDRDLGTLVYY